MPRTIDLELLLSATADDSFEAGVRIDTELAPLAGPGGPVKPAVYEGGKYQEDWRWASPDDDEPTPVIVVDNVPSQANRLEEALRRNRDRVPVPEFVLDLSSLSNLPAHLPKRLSSLEFPHRNADAYLRDARLGDEDFIKTDLGKSIFGATAQEAGPLVAWFPQALLYGFWQSHLGKKRANTKHARAWVSEIVGWKPAPPSDAPAPKVLGLKGDPLNLSVDEPVVSNPDDRAKWSLGGSGQVEGGKKDKLSEMGHGQVPFMGGEAAAAAVSFARVSQRATVSFAQLRRVSLGAGYSGAANAASRALLVALGLYAHVHAFGGSFALRSGADLRPVESTVTWLGDERDDECALGDSDATATLLRDALEHAKSVGAPLEGWREEPVVLSPKDNLRKAIRTTWPDLAG
ncbi:MAG: type I-U CRISPR-associated protein Cas7 [Holophagales bacterium]|nr:type I-U CRISPR-associated protein Cas7 [Holophagales bacterium]MYH23967.1 type I-U CRISPR-associated protein Cas7 [Holophagales bacterium]